MCSYNDDEINFSLHFVEVPVMAPMTQKLKLAYFRIKLSITDSFAQKCYLTQKIFHLSTLISKRE